LCLTFFIFKTTNPLYIGWLIVIIC
jgi:hypothetical protein